MHLPLVSGLLQGNIMKLEQLNVQVTQNCDDDSYNPMLCSNNLTKAQVPNLDVEEWKVYYMIHFGHQRCVRRVEVEWIGVRDKGSGVGGWRHVSL